MTMKTALLFFILNSISAIVEHNLGNRKTALAYAFLSGFCFGWAIMEIIT